MLAFGNAIRANKNPAAGAGKRRLPGEAATLTVRPAAVHRSARGLVENPGVAAGDVDEGHQAFYRCPRQILFQVAGRVQGI